MMTSTRLPKRGDWLLLPSGSVVQYLTKGSSGYRTTLWVKGKNGVEFPYGVAKPYDFTILDNAPTHQIALKRNLYFGGFSMDEMTRTIIFIERPGGNSPIITAVDFKLKQRDSILLDDVAEFKPMKYPIIATAFDHDGVPEAKIPPGRIIEAHCGSFRFFFPDEPYHEEFEHPHHGGDARYYKAKLAEWREIQSHYLGFIPFCFALYDAMRPLGLEEFSPLWPVAFQWALRCRMAEERIGQSEGLINYLNWGDVRMELYSWISAKKQFPQIAAKPPTLGNAWVEYTRTYGLESTLDTDEWRRLVAVGIDNWTPIQEDRNGR
jgi:hypothetical protein